MAIFTDSEEWKKVILGFFQKVQDDKEMMEKIKKVGVMRFDWKNPACRLVVDPFVDDKEKGLRWGDSESSVNVTMTQDVDVSHEFWCGKVNTIVAMATGKIKSTGDVTKLMKLLPALTPLQNMYKEYLQSEGFSKYILK
jgi:putative sterol carrier protein